MIDLEMSCLDIPSFCVIQEVSKQSRAKEERQKQTIVLFLSHPDQAKHGEECSTRSVQLTCSVPKRRFFMADTKRPSSEADD